MPQQLDYDSIVQTMHLAFGMIFAGCFFVGVMFLTVFQTYFVLYNRTNIEYYELSDGVCCGGTTFQLALGTNLDWTNKCPSIHSFIHCVQRVNVYDCGMWQNIKQVFGPKIWMWPIPMMFGSPTSLGDGTSFPKKCL